VSLIVVVVKFRSLEKEEKKKKEGNKQFYLDVQRQV